MNRLHRSKRNKVILGVCGGLAEYFNIDPTLVRIISILVAIPGPGLMIYLVAALVMPEDKGYSGSDQWGGSGNSTGSYSGSYTNTGADSFNGTGSAANSGNSENAGAGNSANTGSYTGANYDTGFESEFSNSDDWGRPSSKYHSEKNKVVLGAILLGLGILFLGKQLMPALFDLKYMIPLLLIGIGGVIVFKGRN